MEVKYLPIDKKIILFDGVCNLCDSSVQFIINHDAKDIFRFVAIQSELGSKIINYLGIDTSIVDSIILYIPNIGYYTKATAVFRIAKELNTWHRYLSFIGKKGNFIYDYIAKNRYQWFGKKESCMIPTSDINNKFLY